MLRALAAILCSALLLTGCLGSDEPAEDGDGSAGAEAALREAKAELRGAPAPLAALHAQANQLLDGGVEAYSARIEELEGHPIVVNQWGSWCPPCRAEFPLFQRQATKRGKEIAFLGVDGQDNDADAREFLEEIPVPFPSYKDPDLRIAAENKAVAGFPSTIFFDRRGAIEHVKIGEYSSERELAADIERYAR